MLLAAAQVGLTISPAAIAATVAALGIIGGLVKIVRVASRIESSVENQGSQLARIEQSIGEHSKELRDLDRRVITIETHLGIVTVVTASPTK